MKISTFFCSASCPNHLVKALKLGLFLLFPFSIPYNIISFIIKLFWTQKRRNFDFLVLTTIINDFVFDLLSYWTILIVRLLNSYTLILSLSNQESIDLKLLDQINCHSKYDYQFSRFSPIHKH